MLSALALTLTAIAGGTLVTYLYDERAPLASRLCAGACVGLTAFGFVAFALSCLLGLTPVAVVIAAAITASPLSLILKPRLRSQMRADIAAAANAIKRAIFNPDRRSIAYLIFYALISISLWAVFDRAMIERADGIYTGVLNNYGDLPFHLSVITRFAYGENFPPESPVFAGARFAYPFIIDFIAATFVSAGASLKQAMFLEGFVFALALAGLLHRWALDLTCDKAAALLSPLLIILSGGLGWLLLIKDARLSEIGIIPLLVQLPHDYTILPEGGWRWGNALTALLVPQRSLLLGLPLAIIIFIQWWRAAEEYAKAETAKDNTAGSLSQLSAFFHLSSSRRMAAAGLIAGLLPLAHTHSFIVVMAMGACLALLSRRWRAWAVFFSAALLIALPQVLWLMRGETPRVEKFFGWRFGWDKGEENFFLFWLKNTGLFIPLLVAAILWKGKTRPVPPRLLLFYLPFTLCFIAPNFIRLAPWEWDNIKVLLYWYIASVPLVALLLAKLWRKGNAYRAAAVALFISLTLAGALDALRVMTSGSEYREFDREGINFAEQVLRSTPARALILHAPVHNHPVFLAGRRSLMGYPGHLWTHGLNYSSREDDIKRIYAGAPDAEDLMTRYGIDYVIVSPLERAAMPVNDSMFNRYSQVGGAGEYHLYKIARP